MSNPELPELRQLTDVERSQFHPLDIAYNEQRTPMPGEISQYYGPLVPREASPRLKRNMIGNLRQIIRKGLGRNEE